MPGRVPRRIAEADHRNLSLLLRLMLQLRSWASATVCPACDNRPGCATGSVANTIDDGLNVPDSLIDRVEESGISHVDGMYHRNQPWLQMTLSLVESNCFLKKSPPFGPEWETKSDDT